MSRRNIHRRRRAQGGCLSFAIGMLTVMALALIVAIVISGKIKKSSNPGAMAGANETERSYVDANNPPVEDYQMVLMAGDIVQGDEQIHVLTPSPTPTLKPSPTPEPTYNPDEPYALVRPQPTEEGFLPIFNKANTELRQIAIIVDECTGAEITKKFAKEAYQHGAKLTLFPSGENVMLRNMGQVLKECAYTLGFEIENRCYSSAARLYKLNDTMMATEIWKQSIAVGYVLGVRYHPHFLRLYGRDGENDLRTHTYLAQEGYSGIVGWTYNGSKMVTGKIGNNLAPGNIYYFKTTESDLRSMSTLMAEAKEQGYEMVTLNKLFGYEENSLDEVANVLSDTMPELENHDIPYYFMKSGDCTWATNLLQRRLIQLGYLPDESADGIFGNGTAAALSAFQAKIGLPATGAADVLTQERIFADDAPSVDEVYN